MDEARASADDAEVDAEVETKRQRKLTEKGLIFTLDSKEKSLKSHCKKLLSLQKDIDCGIAECSSKDRIRVQYTEWMINYERFLLSQEEYLSLSFEAEEREYCEQLSVHDVHFKTFKMKMDTWQVQSLDYDVDEKPSDHISKSKSSPSGLSNTTISSARLKEEQRKAELKVKSDLLAQRQALELKKLKIKMEEERLELDTDIAVNEAKSAVLDRYEEESSSDNAVTEYRVDELLNRHSHLDPGAASFVPHDHDSIDRVSVQGEMIHKKARPATEDVLITVMKQLKKPSPEIRTFSGDPLYYRQFVRQFTTKVVSNTDNADEKLNYLEQFTSGEANRIVRGFSYLNAENGYPAAMNELEERYGNEETIASAFVRRALAWPDIKGDNPKGLNDFSIFLAECDNAVKCITAVKVLEYPDNLKRLVCKLPVYFHDKWRNVVQTKGKTRPIKFHDLAEFVKIEARKANHPMYGREAMQKVTGATVKPQTKKATSYSSSKGTYATSIADNKEQPSKSTSQVESNECSYCGSQHRLCDCERFSGIGVKDRLSFLKTKGMCFKCFRFGHRSRTCNVKTVCSQCKGKHHTLLHDDLLMKSGPQNPSALSACVDQTSPSMGASEVDCAMAIIPVKVKMKGGNVVMDTYAFLDPGSSISFCTEELVVRLGASGKKMKITLDTMGLPHTMHTYCVGGLEVCDLDMNNIIPLPKMFTKDKMPVLPHHIPEQADLQQWPHLLGVKLPSVDAGIHLLIGNNVPDAYTPVELRTGPRGTPHASRTLLGWIVWNLLRHNENCPSVSTVNTATVRSIEEVQHWNSIEQLLKRSYSFDFPERFTDGKKEQSQEDKKFLKKVNESIQLRDGHYQINLPLRNDDMQMPDNRGQALQRLESLRKKMMHKPKFGQDYQTFMSTILKKGFAERIPSDELRSDGRVWYIPHHGVYHPKKPDKIRVVFDCTALQEGVSLNNQLLPGPDLTNNLLGILMRFRQDEIAVMGDIDQMFYQVRVPIEDCDLLRFFWWPEGNVRSEPQEYRMLVHLFGAVSSPSCSNAALRQTAVDNLQDFEPHIVDALNKNFYVDDFLSSVSSDHEAVALVQGITDLCTRGGFHLSKWVSNSHNVLEHIPKEDRAKNVKNLDLSCDDLPSERALGVYWSVENDKLGFNIQMRDKPFTRRGLLSIVSSVYDPLGFASPFTLIAKILQQDLCKRQFDWDEPIPDALMTTWLRWLSDLPRLEQIKLTRCYKPQDFGQVERVELHMFADASESGYGVVAYLRLINEKNCIHCSLLLSKARVAPLKKMTIPRMELTAAALSVRLCKIIFKELDIKVDRTIFWTDSMAVLRYIANETSRFLTFVANRVTVIRDGSDVDQWLYVSSRDNPADAASRGLAMDTFLKSKFWFNGPSFLWESNKNWSKPHKEDLYLRSDDEELKKPINVSLTRESSAISATDRFLCYFSSWHKLKKAVAVMLVFKAFLKAKSKIKFKREISLDTERLKSAETVIIKYLQQKYFADELRMLERGEPVKCSSPVFKLDPIIVDGVIRVGGRLSKSKLDFDSKHQILLPKNSHVTDLILYDTHKQVGHMGKNCMLSTLRRTFWIPGAGTKVKGLVSKCVVCRLCKAKPGSQKMADLPSVRLSPGDPPFTKTGMDFFGNFYVKRGRSEVKRYGVIFTCLVTRAIHLELAQSLSTDSCINAIRRFVSRRGPVEVIISDNGTNLVGAEKELRQEIQKWNTNKITRTLLQKNIDWRFNPPGGSHFGGVWERLIRSVKTVFHCIIKDQSIRLDDESLSTLLCEIEDILNNRPITDVQSDPKDLSPLTPNDLLRVKGGSPLPPGSFSKDDCYVKRRWRQVQFLADQFWRRWSKEYLSLLQERQKWNRPVRNISVGDIVLLVDNSPRNSWPLGKVTDIFTDKKGYVRCVKVRTQYAEFVRPVDKLCLVMESELV